MLADRYFHGKNPIGLHIKVGPTFASPMPGMTVVGVVGDIKQGSRDEATVPQMYEPLAQAAADLGPYGAMIGVAGDMEIVVRSAGDPATLEIALNQSVHQLDPLLAVSDVNTMDEILAATESSRRFNTLIVTSFAAIALLLSLLGIYGVMAYSVTERTREIAIRMALGATRGDVLANTVLAALLLTAIGTLLGAAASLAATRSLASLLFGVTPLDAPTMAAAAGLLFLCSAVAAWLPARRASAVDPMQTLRAE
jgi:putative ABC transport system permease protein